MIRRGGGGALQIKEKLNSLRETETSPDFRQILKGKFGELKMGNETKVNDREGGCKGGWKSSIEKVG